VSALLFYNKGMNQEAVKQMPFFRSRRFNLAILWFLFAAASVGTYILARNLESGPGNHASAFFGNSRTHEIELYRDRVVPTKITAGVGDEVIFIVKDDSYHNMAEERRVRGDARLESGEFGKDESYSLVFQSESSITFYDRLNSDIRVDIEIR
jgi:plastocyanin